MDSSFARLLQAHRERRELSQNALARAVEVSPSTINMLESSTRRPTRDLVRRLARTLDLDRDETDRFLVAADALPLPFDRVAPDDPELLLVARTLADESLADDDLARYRSLIRMVTLGWRAAADPTVEPPRPL